MNRVVLELQSQLVVMCQLRKSCSPAHPAQIPEQLHDEHRTRSPLLMGRFARAAMATPLKEDAASSTEIEEIHSPPDMIRFLLRSEM